MTIDCSACPKSWRCIVACPTVNAQMAEDEQKTPPLVIREAGGVAMIVPGKGVL